MVLMYLRDFFEGVKGFCFFWIAVLDVFVCCEE